MGMAMCFRLALGVTLTISMQWAALKAITNWGDGKRGWACAWSLAYVNGAELLGYTLWVLWR